VKAKYYCCDCFEETPLSEYERLDERFCPKCGGHIEKRDDTNDALKEKQPVSNEDKESSVSEELGTNWLSIWNYVRLPSMVIVLLGHTISSTHFILSTENISYTNLMISIPMFGGALIPLLTAVGLHLRKTWAWKVNWLFIIVPFLIFPSKIFIIPSSWLDYFITFLVSVISWVGPNYIYWKKRRQLFT